MSNSVDRSATLPRPSLEQLAWREMELGMFIHFNMFTYYAEDWVVRHDMPAAAFNPRRLDTDQWLEAAVAMGARYAILTAQHGEGFCLWPTEAYDYSVRQSPWLGGKGDIVERFIRSCHKYGVRPGLYMNIAHNGYCNVMYHSWRDGKGGFKPGRGVHNSPHYKRIVERMLTELCSRYGDLVELWFDGSAVPVDQGGPDVAAITRKYQPNAVIYGATADQPVANCIRWIGHEEGWAPESCWGTAAMEDLVSVDRRALATGNPNGSHYVPAECDVPMRDQGRWVWRPNQESHVFSLDHLIGLYEKSVGRNANWLLNANPDCDGLVPEPDFTRYAELGREIRRRFGHPLAQVAGNGETLVLELPEPMRIDRVILREDISGGERVRRFAVEAQTGNGWRVVGEAGCIGHNRILAIEPVTTQRLRLVCRESVASPVIREFSAHRAEAGPAATLGLELGGELARTRTCRNQLRYLDEGVITADKGLAALVEMRAAVLPRVEQLRNEANPVCSREPSSHAAWELRHLTSGIEECFGPFDGLGQRLSDLERRLRLTYSLPVPLVRFECSGLREPVADIRSVPLPRPGESFAPATAVTDEQFIDVRAFHGDRDGVLYLRTRWQPEQAGSGRLVFGADGPLKVWVNGTELACAPALTNPARRDAGYCLVDWRGDANEIVFALGTNQGKAWGVFAAVL